MNGPEKAFPGYPIPSHLSAVQVLTDKGKLIGGDVLGPMLKGSKPVFEGGAPPLVPEVLQRRLHQPARRGHRLDERRRGHQEHRGHGERARGRVVTTPSHSRCGVGGDRDPRVCRRRLRPVVRRPPEPAASGPGCFPYLLVAPVAVFIVGLALVPAVFTVIQSFYRVNALDPPTRFTGFDNFVPAGTRQGRRRQHRQHRASTSSSARCSRPCWASRLAVVLQKPFRGRSLVIAVLILPWALPGVVEGILWTGIFDSNAGLINGLLVSFHLGGSTRPARPEPTAHDHPHRARAGLADHAVVRAADPRGTAAHPRRAVRGRGDRRLQRLVGLPAHHAAAGPARASPWPWCKP